MESLREKLRRLRRDSVAGGAVYPPEASTTESSDIVRDGQAPADAPPSLVRDALAREPALDAQTLEARQRLRTTLARRDARQARTRELTDTARARNSAESNAADERVAHARAAAVEVLFAKTDLGPPRDLVASGSTLARIQPFVPEHAHGDWRLTEIEHALPATLSLCARDPALADLDLRDALFLDTETTGLSGGAGTYVWLVGLGSFRDEGRDETFELWQGFLPDPSHERALLAEVAERIARAPLVVTFFGKAFDRHRLEDKMRMHGLASPFEKKPHLDLYHSLRRLYGGAFEDSRLRTFEDVLCGVQRAEDLPGAFAPAAWFDFLAGRAHRLEGVFAHNRDDVLSLVTLAAHLGRVVEGARADGRPLKGATRACELALARLHDEKRDFARALLHVERACAASHASEDLELARAQLLMRAKRLEEAHALLTSLAATTSSVLSPRIFLCLARTALAVRDAPESILAHLAHAQRALDQRWTGREHAAGAKELATLRSRLASAASRAASSPRPREPRHGRACESP